ncbi:MAG: ribonuclease P protein component [bacterium]
MFKDLFRFSQKEISLAFKLAKLKNQTNGLKLLQFPIEEIKKLKIEEFAKTFENQIKENTGKILIIISGKVGKAHERNQLRRRIKNIFYEQKLYAKPFISILITYKQALNLTFDQLKQFLVESFE